MSRPAAGGVPVACGALGDYQDHAVARIAELIGGDVAEVHRDGRSVLYLDREPTRWQAGDGRGAGLAWPERLPDRAAGAVGWRDAARGGACGLHLDGEARAIHASSSGLAAIYWMRAGDAVYFATRIDALARAGLGTVSADWQAWAEILTLSFTLGSRTPFTEIHRVGRGARVAVSRNGGLEREDGALEWANGELVSGDEAAERIVASLRADVAAVEPEGPITGFLTGGFDSRLVMAALAERGLVPTTYTGDSDWGDDLEERYAAVVARQLGVSHAYVAAEPRPFRDELAHAADRVEYQSLPHLPIARLAAAHPGGEVCTDGIGGNLLKGRYLRDEFLAAPDPVDAALGSLLPERLPVVFDPDAWSALRAQSRAAFLQDAERYDGHPMQTVLATHVRAIRSIGTAPIGIIGERSRLFMPLVAEEVACAALSAPPAARRDRTFYRQVLDLMSPGLGQLPSTNDGVERARRRPLLRSPEAREAHRELLLRSPLRPWFTPTFDRWIEKGRMGRIDKLPRRINRVQAICIFGLWCERYGDLIGEADPAELFGAPVASGIR